jgi:hypothetical protein
MPPDAGWATSATLPTKGCLTMNLMSGKYLLNQAIYSPEFFDDVQDVHYALEGSVRRSGNQVRITA